MNKKAFVVLMMTPLIIGCNPTSKPIEPIEKNEYEDFYNMNNEKESEITGKSVYYASSGYKGNDIQGYNHYFYKGLNSTLFDLEYKDDAFKSDDGAYLKNEEMHSSTNTLASRVFVSPQTGKAKIIGTIKSLKLEKTPQISIKILNSSGETCKELGPYIVDNEDGLYISETVDLNKDDSVIFTLSSEATVTFNPCVDFLLEDDKLLHQFIDGDYGDVHPYYDKKNKRMIMYYLSTGREVGSVHEQFSTLATASYDMVNFEQIQLSRNEKNPPSINTYYALGVYEDADGNYRSCFGQGSYVGNSKSSDLIYWENGEEYFMNEETGMLDYKHRVNFGSDVFSGRDPHIFYDKQAETYYCIVMNYYSSQIANGKKGLAIYKGSKDGIYSMDYKKALDTTGRGDPECPQIFKIGNRYYIFYSIYGTGTAGNVGKFAYRIGDENASPFDVNWDEKEELYLDGGDNHAAQITEANGKYYMYGWLTANPYQNTWGGTLSLSKEVYQKEDGTLASRADPVYQKLANKGTLARFSSENKTFRNIPRSILKGSFAPTGSEYQEGFKITSKDVTYFAGIIKSRNNTYLTLTKDVANPTSFVYLKLNNEAEKYDLHVYLDGGYLDLFVNDEYALSSHVEFNGLYDVEITSTNFKNVSNARILKLAGSNNFTK